MFHRLVVPTYFGGLPGGYDYVNNAVVGTPALADGPRSDLGPNNGTYFLGFGENARGGAGNRGLKALAQNCDQLDDYLHRDLAIPAVTADVTAGAPVSSIVIAGPIFIGVGGTPNTVAGIRTFLTLVDAEDNEIFNGTECQITAISPDVPGALWSTGNVTLTISPAIPNTTVYRVYYSTRGSAATILSDALVGSRRHYNRYNGGPAWADAATNPPTFITAQLDKIVADLAAPLGFGKIGATPFTPAAPPNAYGTSSSSVGGQIIDIVFALNLIDAAWQAGDAALNAADTALNAAIAVLNAFRLAENNTRTIVANAVVDNPSFDKTIIFGATNITLTLPAPTAGREVWLIDKTGTLSAATPVTLIRNNVADKIDLIALDYALKVPGGRWVLRGDGTDWYLFSC